MGRILVTGSSGLVGTAVVNRLESLNIEIRRFDLLESDKYFGDIRNQQTVHQAVNDCDGIIHLAAVSRVIWGQRNPVLCWDTNVTGLNTLLRAAADQRHRPWLIFASSREVYGQPDTLPASEECPRLPVNVYGRSKLEGERLVELAGVSGLRACTVRLSNVYGSIHDHSDRVVPAFARSAANGHPLVLEGEHNTFDFTHVNDVSRGIVLLCELLSRRDRPPPPIQLVGGIPTSLGQLAALAIEIAESPSIIQHARPRDFDVSSFYGSPLRAREILGWGPEVTLREGLIRLIGEFGCAHSNPVVPEAYT
jgi:UDP-glucose 4-epimerase